MATNNALNLQQAGVATYDGAGAFNASSLTQYSLLVGDVANLIESLGVASDGQIPIGSTGLSAVLSTITEGSGVSITNGPGSIQIDYASQGLDWFVSGGGSATLTINSGMYVGNVGEALLSLPASIPFGSVIRIVGTGVGSVAIPPWLTGSGIGQLIYIESLSSVAWLAIPKGTCIEMICIVEDTTLRITKMMGTIGTP